VLLSILRRATFEKICADTWVARIAERLWSGGRAALFIIASSVPLRRLRKTRNLQGICAARKTWRDGGLSAFGQLDAGRSA
jgi:hypothetical protein